MKISGSITALVTPFKNGSVDESSLRSLVEWQIGSGTHGLLACGTTGESTTLSLSEHLRVIEIVADVADKRLPVIAGASSSNTMMSIKLAEHAQQVGVDAILVAAPAYNRPSQEGLYQHFMAINEAVELPMILYNIPHRSAVEMSIDTVIRLKTSCPKVIGVKDSTSSLSRASLERVSMPEDWIMLSGDDGTTLGYMAHGGNGSISGLANVIPGWWAKLQEACTVGDFGKALELYNMIDPLRRSLTLDGNPVGVKFALSRLGYIVDELRLPLVSASPKTREAIEKEMEKLGLIS